MQNCVIPPLKGCKEHIDGECVIYSGPFIPTFGINNGDSFNTVVAKLSGTEGGGEGSFINNAGDNRILTSNGTQTSIDAESLLTWDGFVLSAFGGFDLTDNFYTSNIYIGTYSLPLGVTSAAIGIKPQDSDSSRRAISVTDIFGTEFFGLGHDGVTYVSSTASFIGSNLRCGSVGGFVLSNTVDGSVSGLSDWTFQPINPATGIAGQRNIQRINVVLNQTTGTQEINLLTIDPISNQSGSFNGITRGIFYNPLENTPFLGLHRAIELVKGDAVFNTLSGVTMIGTTLSTGHKLQVQGTTRISSLSSLGTSMVVADLNGVLSIQPLPLTNPMTGVGDMIYGGALGAPQRLAIGLNGQVLEVQGGIPTWVTPAASGAAGANTQVQFNNFGAFGATPNFTYNGTGITVQKTLPGGNSSTNLLRLTGANPNQEMKFNIDQFSGITDLRFVFNYASADQFANGGFVNQLDGADQFFFGMSNEGRYGGTIGTPSGRFMSYYDFVAGAWRYGFNAAGELFVGPDNIAYGVKLSQAAGDSVFLNTSVLIGSDVSTGEKFQVTGSSKFSTLAGTGTRVVTASSTGVLGASTNVIGDFFVQGGNSPSGAAILGTNNAQELQFETNNVVKVRITTNGNFTLGNIFNSSHSVLIQKNVTGNATTAEVFANGQVQTDVTTTWHSFRSQGTTTAGPHTINERIHYIAQNTTKSGTTAITTQIGYQVDNLTSGAVNYGFYSKMQAGTNKYSLFFESDAMSFFGGQVGVGVSPIFSSAAQLIVKYQGATTSNFNHVYTVNTAALFTGTTRTYYSEIAGSSANTGSVIHFSTGVSGLTGTIGTHIGFEAASTLTLGTAIYGFRGAIVAATGRWNLFMDGTAGNFLQGNTLIGSQTDDGVRTLQVNGSARISSLAGVGTRMVVADANGVLGVQAIPSGGGSMALDDLTDVIITAPTNNQVLLYNGTNWVNAASPAGGGGGEANTASNVGGGLANFNNKVGVNLEFNTFNPTDFDLASNLISIDATLKANWNAAFSWGNHALVGYLTETSANAFYVRLDGAYANPTWITALSWTKITGTPTTLSGYGITDAQPLDGDLTAIAALAGTSGLLRKTAANTWTLDTTVYLTAEADTLQSVTTRGATTTTSITANSFIKSGGAATEFLKANGSIDSNTYLTTAAAAATYEPKITAGTTSQYYRGDKTFQTLDTLAVTENTNLYFTETRVRNTVLTGYVVGANTPLAATDSVLGAFQKIQGQLNNKQASGAYLTANQTITLSSDVSGTGNTAITTTIQPNVVTNTKLAQMPASTIKGNVSGVTANATDLTGTQVTTLLDVFTSTLKGLVPFSGGGTTNFLRADGSWSPPPGSSTETDSKSLTIDAPTATENATMFFTTQVLTLVQVADAIQGSSQSITYQINYAASRNGSPTTIFASPRTTTSAAGSTTSSFAVSSIPANSWVWLTTSAVAGTITDFNVTLTYTKPI